MATPTVNLSGIAALANSSPSTTTTGRPQLSGNQQQSRSTRPSKQRVVGETPMYTREERETLWNWLKEAVAWAINPATKVFGEEVVKDEILSVWHTDIHKMVQLTHDALVVEFLKVEATGVPRGMETILDHARGEISHFKAAMISALERKEGGNEVNSLDLPQYGMSPRARKVLIAWIIEWVGIKDKDVAEKLISRERDRMDLQVMFRFMANVLWFFRFLKNIELRLANRQEKGEKMITKLNKELDAIQNAPSQFHEMMKQAREADRADMEANNASAPQQQRKAAAG